MKFRKLNYKLIACFSYEELKQMTIEAQTSTLIDEVRKLNVPISELMRDRGKMEQIAAVAAEPISNSHQHEVFVAWNIIHPFFKKEAEVCFELKDSFILGKDKITNLDELEVFRSDVLGDFIIYSEDGYRIIELKRYRDGLKTEEVLEFIKKKLASYGAGRKGTNLFVILQSPKNTLDELDFKDLHRALALLAPDIESDVLIGFNANNTTSVLVQVYPEYRILKKPIKWESGEAPSY